ncbi:MAG: Rieske (2Fe-2S) protein [Roseovarius sp.]|jgi:nitrite reductase/ring-hydroxylating ferredoxin subunit|uniref:Ferredoxin n=1 Tax=Marinibacterium profundimaris TaxID=1679460 RepID=A0A225NBD2_9RHOB|nr:MULTISPECIES: Rieske (2Fe-2S) protein [Rhodobacterales]OWU67214.1 ferredoxin [Marinibacterium profundimaris]
MPEKLLCASSDLSDTTVKICEVDGVEIGIIRHNGDVVAYKNVCPHQGGPVCEGLRMPRVCVEFDDQQRALQQNFDESEMHFVCPWHGWEFKMETGEAVGDPKIRLKRYKVTERDGEVYVEI